MWNVTRRGAIGNENYGRCIHFFEKHVHATVRHLVRIWLVKNPWTNSIQPRHSHPYLFEINFIIVPHWTMKVFIWTSLTISRTMIHLHKKENYNETSERACTNVAQCFLEEQSARPYRTSCHSMTHRALPLARREVLFLTALFNWKVKQVKVPRGNRVRYFIIIIIIIIIAFLRCYTTLLGS